MFDLDQVFADDGLLAQVTEGYRLRVQQLEMARAVKAAMDASSVLVAEAGTGTGKTFAYLIPALMSGGKTIISTGTKTLQDQLFNRDIPAVRRALKLPVTVAMLKGRANYVCHYHLERAALEGRFFSREDAGYIPLIRTFARNTDTGDKSELGSVPDDAGVWAMVTSTRDNCLGQDCGHYRECFVMEARKRAMAAEVVVVNHHLFFADVWLRDEGVSELLPACNTVIFDEAHQLPETASLFFGEDVSGGQLLELARDTTAEALVAAKDTPALVDDAAALEKSVRDLRLTLRDESARLSRPQAMSLAGFPAALEKLAASLKTLAELLAAQAERSEGLNNCARRAAEQQVKLERWNAEEVPGYVRWVEALGHGVQLHATPLSVADIFRKQMEGSPRAWIFTSATLAVKSNFSHYLAELGLENATTAFWSSPFNYPEQAILYVPEGLPEPNSQDFTRAVVDAALPVIKASQGRAFLLFTSLRALRLAHEFLIDAFAREQMDYPLLVQGQAGRNELLARFRQHGNAVLLGSQSFWEGVDVRGDALSLVVIDKLPFAPPDDPVLAARIDALKREGRNAFMDYQLPRAAINLKQGAGRLIRDERDHGVLMICDKRLVDSRYGRVIWQGLPPMKRTREADVVEAFLAGLRGA